MMSIERNHMKICIKCKHHKRTYFVSCHHPKLNSSVGINVTMMREMGNEYQKTSIKRNFKEICGRIGRWYEKK